MISKRERGLRTGNRTKTGAEWFGRRPSPDNTNIFSAREQSKQDKQRVLEAIAAKRNHQKWHDIRVQQGREQWYDLGNKALPIEKRREEIMQTIADNRISLLAGETGSGKSTQLAQYALEMGYDRVVYLQPRRVTADEIGERLDEELTAQFEERNIDKPEHLVGISHSARSTIHDDSIIQVMTSAVFTRRAVELREQWKDERVLVVADEIHEANIETEFAVATAAELMTERPSWNMVLMSATLNQQEIQDAYQPINGKYIPSVMVEGRPHEIESSECPDQTVVDVFEQECFESGHKTMIFTDGKRSIENIKKVLEAKYGDKVRVLPLHSKIDEATRHAIFQEKDTPGIHTVIVSTSAGQSGLTIPGLDRVISDGWTKSPELDEEYAEGLPRRLCSRAELIQQRGRGGRDIDGAKFFLALPLEKVMGRHKFAREIFISEDSDKRLDHIPPDIYHTVISRNVLSAAAMDRDFYTLNSYLIHKVKKRTIDDSYRMLRMIGAVDERDEATGIGRMMDKYPLRPELARAMVEVVLHGSKLRQYQLAAIAAAIEAGRLGSGNDEAQENILPAETKDDFTKELDLFVLSLELAQERERIRNSGGEYVAVNDEKEKAFDMMNVDRAWKQYVKICQRAKIDPFATDVLTNHLEPYERQEIYEYLLTGMPHLLYEEVERRPNRGRRKRDKNGEKIDNLPIIHYRNSFGPEKGTAYEYDRAISKKSRLGKFALKSTDIIAGYPRWYENDDGDIVNVIEMGFAINQKTVKRVLGRAALYISNIVKVSRNGKLTREHQQSVGRITIATRETHEKATDQTSDLLVKAAIERPGPALRSLWQLKKELEDLEERVPSARQSYYFNRPILTEHEIEAMVREAATGAGGIGELDANLRILAARNTIHESFYISDEKHAAIDADMPRYMMLGSEYTAIYYHNESPVVYEFPLSAVGKLPDIAKIPDGREVQFRYKYDDGREEYLTSQEVKRRASV